MLIIYIETNFLMSYATGRDLATDRFVSVPSSNVRLALPSCCVMESLSALEAEQRRRNRFAADLKTEIGQIRANVVSPEAHSLVERLDTGLADFRGIIDEFEIRMLRIIEILSREATLIEPTSPIIQAALARDIVDDRTDNLILACILAHASEHPAEPKAFLSENSRCFSRTPDVRAALDGAGIKYFADAAKCLEWRDRSPESRMGS